MQWDAPVEPAHSDQADARTSSSSGHGAKKRQQVHNFPIGTPDML